MGVGFLKSPEVQGLGVGLFGVNFGWHFAAAVMAAHLAFGAALASLLLALPRCQACDAVASGALSFDRKSS